MPELIAITGRATGVHIGETSPGGWFAFGTLCGLNNMGRTGNDYGPRGNIRGPGWKAAKTREVTCEDCYNMAKEMHDAAS